MLRTISISSFIFFLTLTGAKAQIVNIESQRMQTDSDRFVMMVDGSATFRETDGEKFQAVAANLSTQFKSKSLKQILMFLAGADLSRLDKTLISNNAMLHLRYNYKISSLFRWEAFSQYQTSPLTGVNYRILMGTGPRIKLNKNQYRLIYVGSLYMYELEKITVNEIPLGKFHRISSYASINLQSANQIFEWNTITYFQPNILHVNDYRATIQSSLVCRINKKLSLLGQFSGSYDSMPPDGFIPWFYQNTWGFRLSL